MGARQLPTAAINSVSAVARDRRPHYGPRGCHSGSKGDDQSPCAVGGFISCHASIALRRRRTSRVATALLLLAVLAFPPHGTSATAQATCARRKCPPPKATPPSPAPAARGPRPNFVIILTDDQDEVLNSTHPAYMPALNARLAARGVRFSNTLVSTSVCCPSRVALLTGRMPHCSNVTANWAPAGAWGKFSKQRLDGDWLPGWLQGAGYFTALVGKFLNGFDAPLPAKGRCPQGWDVFDALSGARGTYDFNNSVFSLDCAAPGPPLAGQYQTDVIRAKALGYLDRALNGSKPFFMLVTPAAPHKDNGDPKAGWRPPPPAPRHAGLYPGLRLPANPTFNTPSPLIPGPLTYMSNPVDAADLNALYVARLRSLRAVDEMLDAIVARLESRGALNNTYVIYASDNGYHMGQHALGDGKGLNIEEDNRVPLFISGPGLTPGSVSPYQANLLDLPPTLMTLAGLPLPAGLDGLPLPLGGATASRYDATMRAAAAAAATRASDGAAAGAPGGAAPPPLPPAPAVWRRDSQLLEAWDSDAKGGVFPGRTFKALRLCTSAALLNFTRAQQAADPGRPAAIMVPQPSTTRSEPPVVCLKYSVWCKDNGRELYDLSVDPYETTNLITAAPARLLARLDALLSALVHCKQYDCVHPYGVLHPYGDVTSFVQAMDPRHDDLYARLPRFAFASCYPLYVPANERTFTLGSPGFPPNASWASTGIVWPLPGGAAGLKVSGDGA